MSELLSVSHRTRAAGYHNPFATRHVRPGAIGFVFPPGESAETIVRRLEAAAWWGEIVGPHGSGKSTLLETLIPHLEARGRRVVRRTLRAGQRRIGIAAAESAQWNASTVLMVDGYEQLSWPSRRRLLWSCRLARCGLLATAHRASGLTPVFRTTVTRQLAEQVVRRIVGEEDEMLRGVDLQHLLERRRGDLRELLFDLYDVYESQRS